MASLTMYCSLPLESSPTQKHHVTHLPAFAQIPSDYGLLKEPIRLHANLNEANKPETPLIRVFPQSPCHYHGWHLAAGSLLVSCSLD